MTELRIMVTGSRTWEMEGPITRALELVEATTLGTHILVSGACPRGADAIAERLAAGRGWQIERHPADWDGQGRGAGLARNQAMVDTRPVLVIAFQRGGSRGTEHAITAARRAGIPVFIWSAA